MVSKKGVAASTEMTLFKNKLRLITKEILAFARSDRNRMTTSWVWKGDSGLKPELESYQ